MLLPLLYRKLDLVQGVVGLLGGNKPLKRSWTMAYIVGHALSPFQFAAAGKRALRKALPISGTFKGRHSGPGIVACSCWAPDSTDHRNIARQPARHPNADFGST